MNIYNADWISKKQFAYTCPYCWTKVKKDGKPYKNARNIQHIHGSCGDLSNRTESRSSHCPIVSENVEILITDSTKKIS